MTWVLFRPRELEAIYAPNINDQARDGEAFLKIRRRIEAGKGEVTLTDFEIAVAIRISADFRHPLAKACKAIVAAVERY